MHGSCTCAEHQHLTSIYPVSKSTQREHGDVACTCLAPSGSINEVHLLILALPAEQHLRHTVGPPVVITQVLLKLQLQQDKSLLAASVAVAAKPWAPIDQGQCYFDVVSNLPRDAWRTRPCLLAAEMIIARVHTSCYSPAIYIRCEVGKGSRSQQFVQHKEVCDHGMTMFCRCSSCTIASRES